MKQGRPEREETMPAFEMKLWLISTNPTNDASHLNGLRTEQSRGLIAFDNHQGELISSRETRFLEDWKEDKGKKVFSLVSFRGYKRFGVQRRGFE